jgi:hypothetical protein
LSQAVWMGAIARKLQIVCKSASPGRKHDK